MKDFWKSGPQDSVHINRWLTDNCFGDYYTRTGLSMREREMVTFCFLSAQGGSEPQLTSHAKANLRIGNDEDFLIAVISQNVPFIGYPRSLNALRCLREAVNEREGADDDGSEDDSSGTGDSKNNSLDNGDSVNDGSGTRDSAAMGF